MTKYEHQFTPDQYAELMTTLVAGLAASGHFTLPPDKDSDGFVRTEEEDEQVFRYYHPNIGGPGKGGYTGPAAVILAAESLLFSIKLKVESEENGDE